MTAAITPMLTKVITFNKSPTLVYRSLKGLGSKLDYGINHAKVTPCLTLRCGETSRGLFGQEGFRDRKRSRLNEYSLKKLSR